MWIDREIGVKRGASFALWGLMRFLLLFWRALPFADRFTSPRAARMGMWQAFGATLAFGAFHSWLCSSRTKTATQKLVGARFGRGFYRLFFNLQALVSSIALVAFVVSRPQKVVHRASTTERYFHWAVQLASLIVALWSVKELRFRHFSGVESALDAARNRESSAEPEAQTPDGSDGLELERGPYAWSRHPIEWAPLLLLWATPLLKTNWLGFNLATTIYMIFGVWQEEKRLAAKGGEAWRRYCSRVSIVFGRKPFSGSL
ncbi:hypothetical protein IAD21_05894 [Abditibacteriota bacterium]|nr:hypothetical protein IAD21_05894 [Abditibacteriota bacterium]